MQVSHCPEIADGNTIKEIFKFGPDRGNIGPFLRISLAIVYLPVDLSGSSSNFLSGGKIFGMPKKCRKSFRMLIFV